MAASTSVDHANSLERYKLPLKETLAQELPRWVFNGQAAAHKPELTMPGVG